MSLDFLQGIQLQNVEKINKHPEKDVTRHAIHCTQEITTTITH